MSHGRISTAQRRRASLCAFTAAAMLLSGAVVAGDATAAAAPALGALPAATAPSVLGPGQPLPRVRKVISATPATRTAAFEPVAIAIRPVRVGGRGIVSISAARRVLPGRAASGVRLRTVAPAGTVILQASGPGWLCRTDRAAAACRLRETVAPGRAPAAVTILLRGGPTLRGRARTLRARLTWRQPLTSRPGSRRVTRTALTTARVPVDGRLRVRLTRPGPATVQVRALGGTVVPLGARVLGLEGRRAAVRWIQRCLTRADVRRLRACGGRRAPRVRWQADRADATTSGLLTQAIEVPRLRRPRPIVVSLVAVQGGARAVGTVALTAIPSVSARLDPRLSRSRLRGRIIGPDRSSWAGSPVGRYTRVEVGTGRPRVVRPGRTAVVALRGRDLRRVSRVIWTVIDRPGRARRRGGSGPVLRLPVPAGARGQWLVIATIRTRGGTWIQRAEILRVRPPARRAVRRAGPPGRAAATPAQELCRLAAPGGLASLALPGGWTVGNYANTKRVIGDCASPDARIEFSGFLRSGAYLLNNATGAITREGISITRGTFQITAWAALGAAAPPGPFAGEVTAPLRADGTWGAPAGTVTPQAPLRLAPLPAGWSWESPAITFAANGALDVVQSAASPDGETGTASLSGELDASGAGRLALGAANLVVLKTATGDEGGISPSGSVTVTVAGGARAVVAATGSMEAPVTLAKNLRLRDLDLDWTARGIALRGSTAITAGPVEVVARGSGTYRGAEDWTLAQETGAPWTVVSGIRVSKLAGTITRKGDDLTASLKGGAEGWRPSPAVGVERLAAEVTNACPPRAGSACETAEARLVLDLAGTLRLRPQDKGVPFRTTANVSLDTLRFSLAAGISPNDFGPKELNLRGVTLNLSNAGGATCQKDEDAHRAAVGNRGPPPAGGGWGERARAAVARQVQGRLAADQQLSVGLAATGTVVGQDITVAGQVSGDGYCLYGFLQKPLDAAKLGADGGATAPGITNAAVIYSSYDATVSLPPVTPDGKPAEVKVKERSFTLRADFRLPRAWTDKLPPALLGTGSLSATLSRSDKGLGFEGKVSYTLDKPYLLVGTAGTTNLALKSASLTVKAGAGAGFSITAAAKGNLHTAAGRGISESDTPLEVKLGFDLKKLSVTLAASVDAGAAPGKVVKNAFGQQGLDVRELTVQAELGPSPAFGVSADVTLPKRWTEKIQIPAGTPVQLTFNISQSKACFKLAVGKPGQTTPALDIAGRGALVANEASLVIAPSGCKVGDTELSPGFGLSFQGRIGTYPVGVTANVTLPTEDTSFAIKANLSLGAFTLGPVKLDRTLVDLDVDTDPKKPRFALKISGGLTVGQNNRVAVDASVTAANGQVRIFADAQANIALGGFGLRGRLTLDTQVSTRTGGLPRVDYFKVSGNWEATVIGIGVRVAGSLDYDAGVLRSLSADVRVVFDGRIGSVRLGRFEGGVAFRYAEAGRPRLVVRLVGSVYLGRLYLFGWNQVVYSGG